MLAGSLALVGCGDAPKSRLHGTIRYQGKPLTDVTVMFFSPDNQVHRADLKADGSYDVVNVGRGTVRVAFQQGLAKVAARPNPSPAAAVAKAGAPEDKAGAKPAVAPASTPREPSVTLPAMYSTPESSKLTFELTQADQDWSIDLP